MPVELVRGDMDDGLAQFVAALERFQADHPRAEIALYRHGRFSVRVRVIDPSFERQSKGERHDRIWPYLADLAEETLSDLSTLILLTPAERRRSFASFEFDDPVPAVL